MRRSCGLTDLQAEGLESIRHCGEHLLSLINEILDLAKIEAGKMELQEHAFSLPQLLHGLDAIFRHRAAAKAKGLKFAVAADAALPRGVYGDERKLRQALINLLGNAVKYTEAGEVTLGVSRREAGLRFEVRGTGVGILPERVNDLFRPFTRLHDLSAPQESTGLGLAISDRLLKLMGGKLQVQSTPARGSCFWFELVLPAVTEPVPGSLKSERVIVGYRGAARCAAY